LQHVFTRLRNVRAEQLQDAFDRALSKKRIRESTIPMSIRGNNFR
jgi:hypothetical protein